MLDYAFDADAADQLENMLEYIAERDASASARLETLLYERVDQLRRSPFIGRPGRIEGTRELVIHPNYILVYRVDDTHVVILRVLHARQQYP